MNNILKTYLKKKWGINDPIELSAEERAVFNRWNEELLGKEVTIPVLREFLEGQQKITLTEFEEFENDPKKDLYLKVYSRLCRQIVSFIDFPKDTKKLREKALEEEIK